MVVVQEVKEAFGGIESVLGVIRGALVTPPVCYAPCAPSMCGRDLTSKNHAPVVTPCVARIMR